MSYSIRSRTLSPAHERMSPQEDSSAQPARDVAGDAAAAVAATAAAPSIAPKAARRPASALPRRLPLWIALALLAAAAVVSAINGRTLMGWVIVKGLAAIPRELKLGAAPGRR
jgi:hypothetical protein